MKKHLIAAAVATVVAAPAMAQNVTLSGLFDTGIIARDSGIPLAAAIPAPRVMLSPRVTSRSALRKTWAAD